MSADLIIDIRELVKAHGDHKVVDQVNLPIRRGEFFSILGPSGAGKTTVLRILAGLEEPDAGEILIDGRPMDGVPPHRRPVNMVFQSYALFPHLTVAGNIAFGLEMQRISPIEVRRRVEEVLEIVRLTGKDTRLPSQLSGGEQQRVALARALVNRPKVLLLDEPLGALDQQLRQDMQVELKTIQEQVGLTFLCVTHHQEEALTMSDRLAVMDQGHLLQVGTPQEIYESPATPFVSQFIGTSNHLSGSLNGSPGGEGSIVVDLPPRPTLRIKVPEGLEAGHRVLLVLRPERLHLSRDGHGHGFDNLLPARVKKLMYTGSELQYLLHLGGEVVWKIRVPNVGTDAFPYKVGETVYVAWNANEAKVLKA